MLDCCSLRYYGRRFLFCRGRLSNTCNQPTFSSSLSLPFFERAPFPIPIFNSSLARKEKVGRGTFRETLRDRERERESSSISSTVNNTDLESAREGDRFLSSATPSYRAKPG